MSTATQEKITNLVEMLPDPEQDLALEIVKRLVLAWDSDFTKLTSDEAAELEEAEAEYARGECISLDDYIAAREGGKSRRDAVVS